jgi:TPR repeat protein
MSVRTLILIAVGAVLAGGVYLFLTSKLGPSGVPVEAPAATTPAEASGGAAVDDAAARAREAELLLKNPVGDPMDPNDPGQQHYKMGRYPEAIAYWTEQAAKGDANAAHRLGVEFMDGKPGVVQRDYAKAMQYHRQAAAAGNPMSMFDIGTMFEFGFGVPKDAVPCGLWYGRSANYGLAQGQYNFATMLETGEGMAKDEVEAYKFYILGERGGFTGVPYNNKTMRIDAKMPLPTQLMEAKLTKAQIDEGRARANAFKPLDGPLKID